MNPDPDAPMETQLLQLERELFSLTPVETPRRLALRLDRQVPGPVGIGRQVVPSARVVPFQWHRMVVPAAAAVVAVSVLNHLDQPAGRPSGVVKTNPAFPASNAESDRAPVALTSGYVLRTEPILIRPGTWQATEQHYFIQPPGTALGSGYNTPARASGFTPVVFH